MRLVRSVVTAVVLVTTAAGCSAAEEPVPAATPSSTTATETPAAEPSPSSEAFVQPPLPAEATTPDAAGAEAFMRHFWATVNYAYASGDTAAILAISDAGCRGCTGLKDGVESATSVGWRWQDFEWATEQYVAEPPDEASLSQVSAVMILSQDPHIVGPDGARSAVAGERVKAFRALAKWRDGQWWAFEIEYPDEAV